MTELASLNTHADLQLASAATYTPSVHPSVNGFSPSIDDVPEDDSIIRCFCGINEDDGSTVLCEICNTWSHILCYYPDGNVPETHVCVICEPRPHDRKGALERQQHARLMVSPAERKIKKVAPKSHKKKVKDINSASIQTNGWLSGADGHDRASGSPRDQGPPAKRPKTTHRSSASTSNFVPGHSRKRAGSNALNGQSPTKSPRSDSPEGYNGDYYSPEFMRSSNATFQTIEYNSYADLNIPNDLRTWLNDTDALKEISPNLTQKDVFTRWDRNIEALKQTSPGFSSCKREDPSIVLNGQRPVYRWVTANAACSENAYIGELNGTIGRVESYIANPENRWKELRHPEPFVFFHDRLPVYVDCREEGSVLRHVGRSCNPNVKLQIIINGTDFHFCFISTREIAEGEELTVLWHIRDKELEIIRAVNDGGSLRPEDEAHMSTWFTTVLANFGGCACSRLGPGVSCNLGRFDLRNKDRPYTHAASKSIKARKLKRLPAQISPGSTGRATNSRAGSEAVLHGEQDDDLADSRSLSAKSRSQPSSRDITPMTGDVAVGLGVALSDREKRKLLQQEKLFEKMEQDGQGGRKAKRHSGGSALNTPNPSTSKQLGFPDNPSPTTSANTSLSRPRVNGTTSKTVNGAIQTVHRPRPEMVSMPTQTEGDPSAAGPSAPRRRTTGSHISCLLRRIQLETKRRKERSASVSVTSEDGKASPVLTVSTKIETSPSPVIGTMPPPPVPVTLSGEPPKPDSVSDATTMVQGDVEMQDAPAQVDEILQAEPEKLDETPPPASNSADAPVLPPAPPWQSDSPDTSGDLTPVTRPTHVMIPPVPSFLPADSTDQALTSSTPFSSEGVTLGSGASSSAILTQSPGPVGNINSAPLLSPSVGAGLTQPSPAKKKMSLGDWVRKRKDTQEVAALQQAQKEKDAETESDTMSTLVPNSNGGSDELKSDRGEGLGETEMKRDEETAPDNETAVEDVEMALAPPDNAEKILSSSAISSEPVFNTAKVKSESQEEQSGREARSMENGTTVNTATSADDAAANTTASNSS